MATPPSPELDLNNLRAIKVLGNGAMGTVFLVHNTCSDPLSKFPFALKAVEKFSPTAKPDAERRARWEVSVLERVTKKRDPFLPSLIGFFETEEIIAWAIPFCPGGDLNVLRHRQMDGVFSPSVIRFYLAEIVCALKHLHEMGIVYRDLKPENILIQSTGHVTLTDFDLSRDLAQKSLQSLILASEPYPDVNKIHVRTKKLTRFFTLAREKNNVKLKKAKRVLSYEMLYGTTPFRGKNRKDTFGRILMMPPKFPGKPNVLTDLITKLLDKEPTRRLGYARGACEIQEHPFFDGLRWDMLTEVLRPPFIPSRDDVELTENGNGINITEYFKKLRQLPSPLDSPSRDECEYDVSFTEF
nr:serine/threonine-protein kinase UCN-like [Tanacetum cinerariifolium]